MEKRTYKTRRIMGDWWVYLSPPHPTLGNCLGPYTWAQIQADSAEYERLGYAKEQ